LIYTWEPSQAFEALFFLDENVKHEALQGELIDASVHGLRDMFIMDCRREGGLWSAKIDDLASESTRAESDIMIES